MKKTVINFLLFLFPISILAQSFMISNIPIPKTYILDLDPYPCDEVCMKEYLDKGLIFSFLSHANKKLENKEFYEAKMMHISILNLGSDMLGKKIKIALLLPYKKIGKYASSTTNASLAYLMTKSQSFELKTYKIESENTDDIKNELLKISKDDFNYVIAPLTQEGADNIISLNSDINIFIPTINKKDVNSSLENIYFGGIDYYGQNEALLKEAVSPLVIFHDDSSIGEKLAKYQEENFKYIDVNGSKIEDINKTVIEFSIPRRTTNLERYLKDNQDINGSSCFINTPIVKTGMIMSQLTLYDTNTSEITNLLSTQINYDPLLFSMTQYRDRKDMVIANSITEQNNVLIETNAILDNDIVYDWINYTTTVGVDYFYHLLTSEPREYPIEIEENQIKYQIHLVKPGLSKFSKYVRPYKAVIQEIKEEEL